MHHYRSAWKSHSANFFVAVLASSAIFTAGCANMATTAAVSDSLPGTASVVAGQVHGGQQPIAFATVTINFAGTAGVGSAGSVVATTKTADDNAGSFSFTRDPNNFDSSNGGVTQYPSTGKYLQLPLRAVILSSISRPSVATLRTPMTPASTTPPLSSLLPWAVARRSVQPPPPSST